MERISAWAEERTPPVVATLAMFVVVMSFSLFGHSVLHVGRGELASPSDLWSLAASWPAIAHGQFAASSTCRAVRSPRLPALEFALAPVLLVGQAVGLSPHLHTPGEPLQPVVRPRPGHARPGIDGPLRLRCGRPRLVLLEPRTAGAGAGRCGRRGQRRGRLGTPRGLRGPRLGDMGCIGDGAPRNGGGPAPPCCSASASRSSRWPSWAWRRCWPASA